MKKSSAGFTLIELLVVVTILGILAAIALPAMLTAVDRSKQKGTMADMRTIAQGLQLYGVDNSLFPADGTRVTQIVRIIEPYVHTVLRYNDHWMHEYGYASDGRSWYSLESYGRDGVDGLDITTATAYQFELDLVYATGRFVNAPL